MYLWGLNRQIKYCHSLSDVGRVDMQTGRETVEGLYWVWTSIQKVLAVSQYLLK